MSKNRTGVRITAAALAFAFAVSDVVWAAPAPSGATLSPIEALAADPSRFEAPLDFVTLKELHRGPSGRLILHVQDAHSNLSGQQNLAEALDRIMTRYGVRLVLSEGGARDCSLTSVKKIAPPEVWKKLAKSYLVSGRITGEEYLNLVSDHPMKIVGIEDPGLYLASVRHYAELAERREEILEYLARIRASLDKLKRRFYPAELLGLEERKARESEAGESFEAGFVGLLELAQSRGVDLGAYPTVLKLIELKLKERLIDFDLANLEQAALVDEIVKKGGGGDLKERFEELRRANNPRTAQFAVFQNTLHIAREKNVLLTKYPNWQQYGEYLNEFAALDLDAALTEIGRAEDTVYAALLADSEDARTVRAIDRYLGLLETAYRIQMSTDDFETFRANEPDFSTTSFLAFVNRKLAENGYEPDVLAYRDALERGRKALEAFYDSVAARDHAFLRNAERALREEDEKVAVLISGGYHTPHLKALFGEKGYSIAVLTPVVTGGTNQAKYEKLLLSPLRRHAAQHVETVNGKARSGSDGVRAALINGFQEGDLDPRTLADMREFIESIGEEFEAFVRDAAESAALAEGFSGDRLKRRTDELIRQALEAERQGEPQLRGEVVPAGARLAIGGPAESSRPAPPVPQSDLTFSIEPRREPGRPRPPASQGRFLESLKRKLEQFEADSIKTHVEFMSQLEVTIEDLNDYLERNGIDNFAMVYDGHVGQSKHWVAELARERLRVKPVAGVYTGDEPYNMQGYETVPSSDRFRAQFDVLEEHFGTRTFVVMDDAIYSGDQLLQQIAGIRHEYTRRGIPVRILIAIPFMKRAGFEKTKQWTDHVNTIAPGHRIELLETRILEAPNVAFAHRVPDGRSIDGDLARHAYIGDIPYRQEGTEFWNFELLEAAELEFNASSVTADELTRELEAVETRMAELSSRPDARSLDPKFFLSLRNRRLELQHAIGVKKGDVQPLTRIPVTRASAAAEPGGARLAAQSGWRERSVEALKTGYRMLADRWAGRSQATRIPALDLGDFDLEAATVYGGLDGQQDIQERGFVLKAVRKGRTDEIYYLKFGGSRMLERVPYEYGLLTAARERARQNKNGELEAALPEIGMGKVSLDDFQKEIIPVLRKPGVMPELPTSLSSYVGTLNAHGHRWQKAPPYRPPYEPPYLITRRALGDDLDTRAERYKTGGLPLTAARVLDDVLAMVEAVKAAHQGGFFNRDLHPRDIYLHEHSGKLRAQIFDWELGTLTGEPGFELSDLEAKFPHQWDKGNDFSEDSEDPETRDLNAVILIALGYANLLGRESLFYKYMKAQLERTWLEDRDELDYGPKEVRKNVIARLPGVEPGKNPRGLGIVDLEAFFRHAQAHPELYALASTGPDVTGARLAARIRARVELPEHLADARARLDAALGGIAQSAFDTEGNVLSTLDAEGNPKFNFVPFVRVLEVVDRLRTEEDYDLTNLNLDLNNFLLDELQDPEAFPSGSTERANAFLLLQVDRRPMIDAIRAIEVGEDGQTRRPDADRRLLIEYAGRAIPLPDEFEDLFKQYTDTVGKHPDSARTGMLRRRLEQEYGERFREGLEEWSQRFSAGTAVYQNDELAVSFAPTSGEAPLPDELYERAAEGVARMVAAAEHFSQVQYERVGAGKYARVYREIGIRAPSRWASWMDRLRGLFGGSPRAVSVRTRTSRVLKLSRNLEVGAAELASYANEGPYPLAALTEDVTAAAGVPELTAHRQERGIEAGEVFSSHIDTGQRAAARRVFGEALHLYDDLLTRRGILVSDANLQNVLLLGQRALLHDFDLAARFAEGGASAFDPSVNLFTQGDPGHLRFLLIHFLGSQLYPLARLTDRRALFADDLLEEIARQGVVQRRRVPALLNALVGDPVRRREILDALQEYFELPAGSQNDPDEIAAVWEAFTAAVPAERIIGEVRDAILSDTRRNPGQRLYERLTEDPDTLRLLEASPVFAQALYEDLSGEYARTGRSASLADYADYLATTDAGRRLAGLFEDAKRALESVTGRFRAGELFSLAGAAYDPSRTLTDNFTSAAALAADPVRIAADRTHFYRHEVFSRITDDPALFRLFRGSDDQKIDAVRQAIRRALSYHSPRQYFREGLDEAGFEDLADLTLAQASPVLLDLAFMDGGRHTVALAAREAARHLLEFLGADAERLGVYSADLAIIERARPITLTDHVRGLEPPPAAVSPPRSFLSSLLDRLRGPSTEGARLAVPQDGGPKDPFSLEMLRQAEVNRRLRERRDVLKAGLWSLGITAGIAAFGGGLVSYQLRQERLAAERAAEEAAEADEARKAMVTAALRERYEIYEATLRDPSGELRLRWVEDPGEWEGIVGPHPRFADGYYRGSDDRVYLRGQAPDLAVVNARALVDPLKILAHEVYHRQVALIGLDRQAEVSQLTRIGEALVRDGEVEVLEMLVDESDFVKKMGFRPGSYNIRDLASEFFARVAQIAEGPLEAPLLPVARPGGQAMVAITGLRPQFDQTIFLMIQKIRRGRLPETEKALNAYFETLEHPLGGRIGEKTVSVPPSGARLATRQERKAHRDAVLDIYLPVLAPLIADGRRGRAEVFLMRYAPRLKERLLPRRKLDPVDAGTLLLTLTGDKPLTILTPNAPQRETLRRFRAAFPRQDIVLVEAGGKTFFGQRQGIRQAILAHEAFLTGRGIAVLEPKSFPGEMDVYRREESVIRDILSGEPAVIGALLGFPQADVEDYLATANPASLQGVGTTYFVQWTSADPSRPATRAALAAFEEAEEDVMERFRALNVRLATLVPDGALTPVIPPLRRASPEQAEPPGEARRGARLATFEEVPLEERFFDPRSDVSDRLERFEEFLRSDAVPERSRAALLERFRAERDAGTLNADRMAQALAEAGVAPEPAREALNDRLVDDRVSSKIAELARRLDIPEEAAAPLLEAYRNLTGRVIARELDGVTATYLGQGSVFEAYTIEAPGRPSVVLKFPRRDRPAAEGQAALEKYRAAAPRLGTLFPTTFVSGLRVRLVQRDGSTAEITLPVAVLQPWMTSYDDRRTGTIGAQAQALDARARDEAAALDAERRALDADPRFGFWKRVFDGAVRRQYSEATASIEGRRRASRDRIVAEREALRVRGAELLEAPDRFQRYFISYRGYVDYDWSRKGDNLRYLQGAQDPLAEGLPRIVDADQFGDSLVRGEYPERLIGAPEYFRDAVRSAWDPVLDGFVSRLGLLSGESRRQAAFEAASKVLLETQARVGARLAGQQATLLARMFLDADPADDLAEVKLAELRRAFGEAGLGSADVTSVLETLERRANGSVEEVLRGATLTLLRKDGLPVGLTAGGTMRVYEWRTPEGATLIVKFPKAVSSRLDREGQPITPELSEEARRRYETASRKLGAVLPVAVVTPSGGLSVNTEREDGSFRTETVPYAIVQDKLVTIEDALTGTIGAEREKLDTERRTRLGEIGQRFGPFDWRRYVGSQYSGAVAQVETDISRRKDQLAARGRAIWDAHTRVAAEIRARGMRDKDSAMIKNNYGLREEQILAGEPQIRPLDADEIVIDGAQEPPDRWALLPAAVRNAILSALAEEIEAFLPKTGARLAQERPAAPDDAFLAKGFAALEGAELESWAQAYHRKIDAVDASAEVIHAFSIGPNDRLRAAGGQDMTSWNKVEFLLMRYDGARDTEYGRSNLYAGRYLPVPLMTVGGRKEPAILEARDGMLRRLTVEEVRDRMGLLPVTGTDGGTLTLAGFVRHEAAQRVPKDRKSSARVLTLPGPFRVLIDGETGRVLGTEEELKILASPADLQLSREDLVEKLLGAGRIRVELSPAIEFKGVGAQWPATGKLPHEEFTIDPSEPDPEGLKGFLSQRPYLMILGDNIRGFPTGWGLTGEEERAVIDERQPAITAVSPAALDHATVGSYEIFTRASGKKNYVSVRVLRGRSILNLRDAWRPAVLPETLRLLREASSAAGKPAQDDAALIKDYLAGLTDTVARNARDIIRAGYDPEVTFTNLNYLGQFRDPGSFEKLEPYRADPSGTVAGQIEHALRGNWDLLAGRFGLQDELLDDLLEGTKPVLFGAPSVTGRTGARLAVSSVRFGEKGPQILSSLEADDLLAALTSDGRYLVETDPFTGVSYLREWPYDTMWQYVRSTPERAREILGYDLADPLTVLAERRDRAGFEDVPIRVLEWGVGDGTIFAALQEELDRRQITNVEFYGFANMFFENWFRAPEGSTFILDDMRNLRSYFNDPVHLMYSLHGLLHLPDNVDGWRHLGDLRRILSPGGFIATDLLPIDPERVAELGFIERGLGPNSYILTAYAGGPSVRLLPLIDTSDQNVWRTTTIITEERGPSEEGARLASDRAASEPERNILIPGSAEAPDLSARRRTVLAELAAIDLRFGGKDPRSQAVRERARELYVRVSRQTLALRSLGAEAPILKQADKFIAARYREFGVPEIPDLSTGILDSPEAAPILLAKPDAPAFERIRSDLVRRAAALRRVRPEDAEGWQSFFRSLEENEAAMTKLFADLALFWEELGRTEPPVPAASLLFILAQADETRRELPPALRANLYSILQKTPDLWTGRENPSQLILALARSGDATRFEPAAALVRQAADHQDILTDLALGSYFEIVADLIGDSKELFEKVVYGAARNLAGMSEATYAKYLTLLSRADIRSFYSLSGVPGIPADMTFGFEIELAVVGSDGTYDNLETSRFYGFLRDQVINDGKYPDRLFSEQPGRKGWLMKIDSSALSSEDRAVEFNTDILQNDRAGFEQLNAGLLRVQHAVEEWQRTRRRAGTQVRSSIHIHVGHPEPSAAFDRRLVAIFKHLEDHWAKLSPVPDLSRITFPDSAIVGDPYTRKNRTPWYISDKGTVAFNIFSARVTDPRSFQAFQMVAGIAMNIVHRAGRASGFGLLDAGLLVTPGYGRGSPVVYSENDSYALRVKLDALYEGDPAGKAALLKMIVRSEQERGVPVVPRLGPAPAYREVSRKQAYQAMGLELLYDLHHRHPREWMPKSGVKEGVQGWVDTALATALSDEGAALKERLVKLFETLLRGLDPDTDRDDMGWVAGEFTRLDAVAARKALSTTFVRRHVLSAHPDKVARLAWSSSGRVLATGSHDNRIRVWDPVLGTAIHDLEFDSVPAKIGVSNDGRFVAATSPWAPGVAVWDTVSRSTPVVLGKDKARIVHFHLSDSGDILTGHEDGQLVLWRYNRGTSNWAAAIVVAPHKGGIKGWAMGPDAGVLVTVDASGRVFRWNTGDLSILSTGDLSVTGGIQSLKLSADGSVLAVWTARDLEGHARITVHRVADWARIYELEPEATVRDTDLSSDGRYLAVSDDRGGVQVYGIDAAEGRAWSAGLLSAMPLREANEVRFVPGSNELIMAGDDPRVFIHSPREGRVLAVLPHYQGVSALGAEGPRMAFPTGLGKVTIWESLASVLGEGARLAQEAGPTLTDLMRRAADIDLVVSDLDDSLRPGVSLIEGAAGDRIHEATTQYIAALLRQDREFVVATQNSIRSASNAVERLVTDTAVPVGRLRLIAVDAQGHYRIVTYDTARRPSETPLTDPQGLPVTNKPDAIDAYVRSRGEETRPERMLVLEDDDRVLAEILSRHPGANAAYLGAASSKITGAVRPPQSHDQGGQIVLGALATAIFSQSAGSLRRASPEQAEPSGEARRGARLAGFRPLDEAMQALHETVDKALTESPSRPVLILLDGAANAGKTSLREAIDPLDTERGDRYGGRYKNLGFEKDKVRVYTIEGDRISNFFQDMRRGEKIDDLEYYAEPYRLVVSDTEWFRDNPRATYGIYAIHYFERLYASFEAEGGIENRVVVWSEAAVEGYFMETLTAPAPAETFLIHAELQETPLGGRELAFDTGLWPQKPAADGGARLAVSGEGRVPRYAEIYRAAPAVPALKTAGEAEKLIGDPNEKPLLGRLAAAIAARGEKRPVPMRFTNGYALVEATKTPTGLVLRFFDAEAAEAGEAPPPFYEHAFTSLEIDAFRLAAPAGASEAPEALAARVLGTASLEALRKEDRKGRFTAQTAARAAEALTREVVGQVINLDHWMRGKPDEYLDVLLGRFTELRSDTSFRGRSKFFFITSNPEWAERAASLSDLPSADEKIRYLYIGDAGQDAPAIRAQVEARLGFAPDPMLLGFIPIQTDAAGTKSPQVIPVRATALFADLVGRLKLDAGMSPLVEDRLKQLLEELVINDENRADRDAILSLNTLRDLQTLNPAAAIPYLKLAIRAVEKLDIDRFMEYVKLAVKAIGSAA